MVELQRIKIDETEQQKMTKHKGGILFLKENTPDSVFMKPKALSFLGHDLYDCWGELAFLFVDENDRCFSVGVILRFNTDDILGEILTEMFNGMGTPILVVPLDNCPVELNGEKEVKIVLKKEQFFIREFSGEMRW